MHKFTTRLAGAVASALLAGQALAASRLEPLVLPPAAQAGPAVQPYVKAAARRILLTHVRLIDGTGGPAQDDRAILIEDGRIAAVGPSAAAPPADALVLDLSGHTVLPGLVGMHDHMYYIARPNLDAAGHSEPPLVVPQMTFSSPRLYLANGVTTLRTAGSVEPYADLNLKRLIDAGTLPGPHMDVTAPYLEGANSPFIQMHQLRDAEDARATVSFWADQGATSFKAYMNITRAELKAAIDEAHRRGLKLNRPPLLGDLSRGRRAGDRQPGARLLGQHPARSRQGAGRLQLHGRRPDPAGHGARQPAGRGPDQAAGRPKGGGHLHPAGLRTGRRGPCAAVAPGDGGADPRGAGGLSLQPQPHQQRAPRAEQGPGHGLRP